MNIFGDGVNMLDTTLNEITDTLAVYKRDMTQKQIQVIPLAPNDDVDPATGVHIMANRRDFGFQFALIEADFGEPEEGDQLIVNGKRHDVSSLFADGPVFEWSDVDRTRVRVHTIERPV